MQATFLRFGANGLSGHGVWRGFRGAVGGIWVRLRILEDFL